MKSFGSYISKYLVSFVAFILILLFLNAVVFGLTFQKIVTEDYGASHVGNDCYRRYTGTIIG